MENYGVTWEKYGSLCQYADEALFNALVPMAARLLERLTAQRIVGMEETDWRFPYVQDAIFTLVERMAMERKTGQGSGLAGFNTDGYSESYRAASAEEVAIGRRSAVFAILSGTGLMSAL